MNWPAPLPGNGAPCCLISSHSPTAQEDLSDCVTSQVLGSWAQVGEVAGLHVCTEPGAGGVLCMGSVCPSQFAEGGMNIGAHAPACGQCQPDDQQPSSPIATSYQPPSAVGLAIPILRVRKPNPERVSHLPKVTQQVNGRHADTGKSQEWTLESQEACAGLGVPPRDPTRLS